MTLEADILKGKYFPKDSRDRLRAIMVSLLVYLPGMAMAFDLYESIKYGYHTMEILELGTMFLLYGSYIFFPRFLSIDVITNIILAIFSTFLLLSLVVPDYNAEFTLFWFATLPIVAFFFLGKVQGIRWTLIISSGFSLLWILSKLGYVTPLYNDALLLQIIFAYLSVSYIVYAIELERSQYEKKLNTSVENNRLLFKEVHHRTKNNMQVMMGLLETQSFKIDDPKYKKMFLAHVDRIKAMSFVHENLYKSSSYDQVDMHMYLEGILNNLQKITQHTLITDIDYVTLGIKDSINLGLIVNEAVSNAIEHAYSAGTYRIDVTLKCHKKNCILTIKDEGIGFNAEKTHQSLGMTLIEDLSLSLPEGSLKIYTDNGTTIKVYFKA